MAIALPRIKFRVLSYSSSHLAHVVLRYGQLTVDQEGKVVCHDRQNAQIYIIFCLLHKER
jgi:hypothetical protein